MALLSAFDLIFNGMTAGQPASAQRVEANASDCARETLA
jgi:hypothetical protein